ncbi:hypothetical protein H4219_002829 [Mycoemilia scoparia]|uniref:Anoctamin transmembrane domain-containing protein n=1 Tax=Mycoemilia scoparia TaxID=417184 RepID=A0A9W8A0C4_9FUNG|nr:hypothetical protein H4219_002829 [Mycoemilia scoparia]
MAGTEGSLRGRAKLSPPLSPSASPSSVNEQPLRFMKQWLLQSYNISEKQFEINTPNNKSPTTTAAAADIPTTSSNVDNQTSATNISEEKSYADYVIHFQYTPPSRDSVLKQVREAASGEAKAQAHRVAKEDNVISAFSSLMLRLKKAGLDIEVREALNVRWFDSISYNVSENASPTSINSSHKDSDENRRVSKRVEYVPKEGELLLFVSCPERRLLRELAYCRVNDWLNGIHSHNVSLGSTTGLGDVATGSSPPVTAVPPTTPIDPNMASRSGGNGNSTSIAGGSGIPRPPPQPSSVFGHHYHRPNLDILQSEEEEDFEYDVFSSNPSIVMDNPNAGGNASTTTTNATGAASAPTPFQLFDITPETLDKLDSAERKRLVYRIITGPENEMGAAVNTDTERWIKSIVPLHDRKFNKQWLRRWSVKWLIDYSDLNKIRANFGDEIAMYFAFLQNYFLWLIAPTVFGILTYLRGTAFSWGFAILIVGWSIFLTETWQRRQTDLASYWGTKGIEKSDADEGWRPQFQPDRWVIDPVTQKSVPYFSNRKRWARRAFGFPILVLVSVAMAAVVSFMFALQTFFEEYYEGPFQLALVYFPTVLYCAFIPVFTSVCRKVARRLNDYENYEKESEYIAHYTEKIFIFQFLQDQLYLILTAWVFIPFRDNFETWLRSLYGFIVTTSSGDTLLMKDADGKYLYQIKKSHTPAPEKLQSLLLYFIITGQVINLVLETIAPMVMRYWKSRKEMKIRRERERITKLAFNNARKVNQTEEDQQLLQDYKDAEGMMQRMASFADLDSHSSEDEESYDDDDDDDEDDDNEQEKNSQGFENVDGNSPITTSSVAAEKPSISRSTSKQSTPTRLRFTYSGIHRKIKSSKYEQKFIARVTTEVELPSYDIYEDYAEMASQFGYVTFFSIIWPLAPLCAFINNWIELRSDAAKICLTVRRPIPSTRVESIGPWLDTLRFTSWLASISNALLVYQFNTQASWLPATDKESMDRYGRTDMVLALVITILSEHLFMVARYLFRQVLKSWPCASEKREQIAKAKMKQKWWRKFSKILDTNGGRDFTSSVVGGSGVHSAGIGASDAGLRRRPGLRGKRVVAGRSDNEHAINEFYEEFGHDTDNDYVEEDLSIRLSDIDVANAGDVNNSIAAADNKSKRGNSPGISRNNNNNAGSKHTQYVHQLQNGLEIIHNSFKSF